jgi:hypothetical protein
VPSSSRISGTPDSPAICSAYTCFADPTGSAAPPRTVKSSPTTTAGTPPTRARPNTVLVVRKSVTLPSCA